LASVMEDGSSAARVAAAQAMMDRGWGKAEQPITGVEGGAAITQRVELVIVDAAG